MSGQSSVDWGVMGGPGKFAEVNGVKLHYDVYGDGEPLLLIMGLGTPMWAWEPQVREFSKHFKTIAYDNRGVGRSPLPAEPFGIDDMAADGVALLDHLGIKKAHVMGASMGGFIAQTIAIKYPERVDRLVLACTGSGGADQVRPEAWVFQEMLKPRDYTSMEDMLQGARVLFSEKSIATQLDKLEAWGQRQEADPVSPQAVMAHAAACLSFDRSRDVGSIKARTLVIDGDQDIILPPENSRRLAASIAGAKLILYPETGHGFTFEAADDVNRDVVAFLTAP
ncbi:MAG: alpha/beta fold hydrolase [Bacillota bacterium]